MLTFAKRCGAVLGAALALSGCRTRPAETTQAALDQIAYPVVVIHDGTALTVHRTRDDLLVMGVQRVISRRDDPVLIDAGFKVFVLGDLRSTKGSGRLMLSAGTGSTPVTFELQARPELSGLEAARRLILDCKYLATGDPDAEAGRRSAIAGLTSMPAIVDLLTED